MSAIEDFTLAAEAFGVDRGAPSSPPVPVVIDSATPSTGSILGGTTVRIEGSGFMGQADSVAFCGVAALSWEVLSDGQIDAITGGAMDTDPGTGDVAVGPNTGGSFTYPQPVIAYDIEESVASVDLPAGTEDGDLLVAFGYMEGASSGDTIVLPAGFTQRAIAGTGLADIVAGTKVASGETGPYVFQSSGSASDDIFGVVVRVPAGIGSIYDSASASASMGTGTGSQTIPDLNPTASPFLLLVWAATAPRGGSNPFTLSIDNGPWTNLVAVTQSNTTANGICAYKYVDADTTGVTTVSIPGATGSRRKGGIMLAVEVG